MPSSRLPRRTRPPVEQNRMADAIRRAIRTGRLKPGDQLPPRPELAARHRVSSLTVQRAVNQLLEDGFVETRSRRGTFIAAHPPHLHRFGLAFQPTRHDPYWSNLWEALVAAAERIERQGFYRFERYLGVDRHMDTEDCRRLRRDLERGALAGIVFDQFSVQAADALGLRALSVPGVGIMQTAKSGGLPGITPALDRFFDQALDRLRRQGRQRIAVVALGKQDVWEQLPGIAASFRRHGIDYRSEWVQGVPLPATRWARHSVRLLFGPTAAIRPDALIVADDNLIVPVVEELGGLPLRTPEDVRVVSLCNWPKLPDVPMAIDWLGFDLEEMLWQAVDLLRTSTTSDTVARTRICQPRWMGD